MTYLIYSVEQKQRAHKFPGANAPKTSTLILQDILRYGNINTELKIKQLFFIRFIKMN